MLVSCPIELTPGRHPDHAKEGEDAWVRRLLGIPEADDAVLLSLNGQLASVKVNGRLDRVSINEHRAAAIRSWMLVRFERMGLFGAVTVIANASLDSVLLQKKDHKHPNPECRGRFSLFGGTRQAAEGGPLAGTRELYEEIRDPIIVDEIVACVDADAGGEFPLAGVQWPGQYKCYLSVAVAPTDEKFEEWARALMHASALAESNPACLREEGLMRALQDERDNIGSRFVASHNVLIENALGLGY